ncbi:hypothetical protein CAC42_4370 [Sphaceloma murrayae]|uniref:Uncharacterized protein n=1 Tax=Sphaceloma murrayae TaxID=2082308 RepID=A0A2K1QM75_9PEZI|nr:hypothetical protein CAC42_4370 [Sphaceloma murrayae]
MPAKAPRTAADIHIAIICALPLEATAVQGILDADHKHIRPDPADDNSYTVGSIGEHHVVVVHLSGVAGVPDATAAEQIKSSFPDIRLALVSGICGAVPRYTAPFEAKERYIHLGDLVISTLLVQVDTGIETDSRLDGSDWAEDNLDRPSRLIDSLLAKLQTKRHRSELAQEVSKMLHILGRQDEDCIYPGYKSDILFKSSYMHKHQAAAGCKKCQSGKLESCEKARLTLCTQLGCSLAASEIRPARPSLDGNGMYQPDVHLGRISTGHRVIRSAVYRDSLAETLGVCAFEMGGGNAWGLYPCLVIKGVSDYADSHKSYQWQLYAAAVAAAGLKVLLLDHWLDQSLSPP